MRCSCRNGSAPSEKTNPSNGSGTKFTPGGRSRARTKSTSGHVNCGGSVPIGSSTFNVACSYEFYGVPMSGSVVHEVRLRRCLEACEQDANCRAVSFLEKRVYGNLDEAEGSCVFQSSVVAGRQLPEEEGGRLIGKCAGMGSMMDCLCWVNLLRWLTFRVGAYKEP